MDLDLNQIIPSVVRSVAVGVVVPPLSLSVSGTLNAGGTTFETVFLKPTNKSLVTRNNET